MSEEETALFLQCPLYQMHLQKIVGFRPPLEFINKENLIYSPRFSYAHIDNSSKRDFQEPVSSICWRICNKDESCIAYVHLLDTDECYGYSYFERTSHYQAIGNDLPLVADAEAIFYEKTCLKVPDTCKSRLWTLTKIPGTSLIFQGKKTIPTLVTRRECAENCLFETDFNCLSASFAPSYRNNRDRSFQQDQPQKHITLGRCILSDKDKMIQPDAFRAAPYDEEYIENQCYEREMENDQCSYELYANSSFIYAEAKLMGLDQKECQSRCTQETSFYCQGVSFYYEKDLTNTECLLHSEDLISMGPRSLKERENSVYMRRVKCLDVQVICTNNEMAIKYTPKDWFSGKMYVSLHSKDCVALGNGTKSTLLRLPIGSEIKENRCGILRAYEVTRTYQRIFVSTLIVIQNNANVQTQGDRLIKVGCIMSNSTLKNGIDDTNSEEEEIPNAIALESSLDYAQSTLPNEGFLQINNTIDPTILPKITLQIIDLSHQHETNDVQIGQNLELQIVAEYTPQQQLQNSLRTIELPPLPDFRATSLIAKTPDNKNFVLLIDNRGCPTDVSVFPALKRIRTHSKNILHANFHAFKFAGNGMVNFDVKIHFCGQRCPEINCIQNGTGVGYRQHGRSQRKRRELQLEPSHLKVQNPIYISTVMDIKNLPENANKNISNLATEYYMNYTDTLPLNYNLHVRGPDMTNSNSYIYGERGVLLIAGIDDQLNLDSICLNQSLLIAIFIFWLIFQIAFLFSCCYVLQKYKGLAALDEERRKIYESFDYMDSRRVHWADQGGYTL
ncbi:uncharacterized protein LOC119676740 [Teleopsis dalmanni]|uniref:uncharacterized protein LOC119676740 n=1 Tax=Teleopsis dalmanni TaxID=139649 RepID=UPI0018CE227A|nr:uncharacterized protein LOC119676740 [Teleopsis dalmanni]